MGWIESQNIYLDGSEHTLHSLLHKSAASMYPLPQHPLLISSNPATYKIKMLAHNFSFYVLLFLESENKYLVTNHILDVLEPYWLEVDICQCNRFLQVNLRNWGETALCLILVEGADCNL